MEPPTRSAASALSPSPGPKSTPRLKARSSTTNAIPGRSSTGPEWPQRRFGAPLSLQADPTLRRLRAHHLLPSHVVMMRRRLADLEQRLHPRHILIQRVLRVRSQTFSYAGNSFEASQEMYRILDARRQTGLVTCSIFSANRRFDRLAALQSQESWRASYRLPSPATGSSGLLPGCFSTR